MSNRAAGMYSRSLSFSPSQWLAMNLPAARSRSPTRRTYGTISWAKNGGQVVLWS